MKRKICLILACCLLFSTLVGCNNINTNNISQEQENMTETLSTKDTLILKQNPSISITSSYYTEEDIELSYSELYEMDTQQYVESRELKIFADFIKEKFEIDLDENWDVSLHYIDEDAAIGTLNFCYMIGSIETDKSIHFSLESGKAHRVSYSQVDKTVDREDILNRVQLFESKYEQQRYVEESKEFVDEHLYYQYFHETDELVYFYTLYFLDVNNEINNDYQTICFIDQDGKIVNQ